MNKTNTRFWRLILVVVVACSCCILPLIGSPRWCFALLKAFFLLLPFPCLVLHGRCMSRRSSTGTTSTSQWIDTMQYNNNNNESCIFKSSRNKMMTLCLVLLQRRQDEDDVLFLLLLLVVCGRSRPWLAFFDSTHRPRLVPLLLVPNSNSK